MWKEFGSAPWVTYTVVAVDYAVTLFGFFVFFEYFMPLRVRTATEQDVAALLEIEQVCRHHVKEVLQNRFLKRYQNRCTLTLALYLSTVFAPGGFC